MGSGEQKARPPRGGGPPPLRQDDAAVAPRIRGPVVRGGAQSAAAVWED